MNYTKGKWTAEHWVKVKGQGDIPTEIFASKNGERMQVASINFDINRDLNADEAHANAKLISKAPEMYEALKDISERAQLCRRILKSNKYTKGEWNILNTEKIESLLEELS